MVESIIPRRGRTPKTPPPALAARLVEARLKAGATQKELAGRLGCAWRSVQDYEQGKAVPGGAVLASYGELGVDLNWLLNGTDAIGSSYDGDSIRVPHFQLSDVDTDFAKSNSSSPMIQLGRSWLEQFHCELSEKSDTPKLASISVEDDSMAPEVPKGSMVIFQSRPTQPMTPGLYVVPIGSQLAVRLFRIALDGNIEFIELKYPARPVVVEINVGDLPRTYQVIATLAPQISPVEIFD